MSITFVSAFIEQRQGRAKRHLEDYWQHFETLAASGLPLSLFLDPSLRALAVGWCKRFSNVLVLDYVELADTAICRLLADRPVQLPVYRGARDSLEYMMIGNSKLEWLQRAARLNPFATTHFAWIDFGVAHILREPVTTLTALKHFEPRYPLIAPGCYRRDPYSDAQIWSQVCWHYCGGFLVCDAANAQYLNDEFLHCASVEYPRFSWDVNFWTVLELKYGEQFSWYEAEFDDTMRHLPTELCLNASER